MQWSAVATCLKELTKTMRNLSRNSRPRGRDLNSESPEYETEVIITRRWHSVSVWLVEIFCTGFKNTSVRWKRIFPTASHWKEPSFDITAARSTVLDSTSSTHLFVYSVYWHSDWAGHMLLVFMFIRTNVYEDELLHGATTVIVWRPVVVSLRRPTNRGSIQNS
jgi:hypothetical protein